MLTVTPATSESGHGVTPEPAPILAVAPVISVTPQTDNVLDLEIPIRDPIDPIIDQLDKLAEVIESAAYRIVSKAEDYKDDPALLVLTMLQVLNLHRQLVAFHMDERKRARHPRH